MSHKPFHFKQFTIEQDRSAMKVGSDGVLLGALLPAEGKTRLMEFGAGTGVVSLMAAQRFPQAEIMAVEIEPEAFAQCRSNFQNSSFANRLQVVLGDVLTIEPAFRPDHIFFNPPYHIDSLMAAQKERSMARHASLDELLAWVNKGFALGAPKLHLSMIVPVQVWEKLKLYLFDYKIIDLVYIKSFPHSKPIRVLCTIARVDTVIEQVAPSERSISIYEREKEYSAEYRTLLKNFLIIF